MAFYKFKGITSWYSEQFLMYTIYDSRPASSPLSDLDFQRSKLRQKIVALHTQKFLHQIILLGSTI